MKQLLFILPVLSLLCSGCANWHTLNTANYNGKTFKYQSRNIKSSGMNRMEWRIRYGHYKPVYLNAYTLDSGPPYSTDIYAEKAFIFKNDTLQYSDEIVHSTKNHTSASMLYIPFKDSEDEVGSAYFELINNNWPLFDSLFQGAKNSGMPVIIGIVQGSRTSFNRIFKGTIKGKKMTLRIENDGSIMYENDDKGRQTVYSGLSEMVKMPGQRLYLKSDADALTINELKGLKNQYGTDPTHYFDIQLSNEK